MPSIVINIKNNKNKNKTNFAPVTPCLTHNNNILFWKNNRNKNFRILLNNDIFGLYKSWYDNIDNKNNLTLCVFNIQIMTMTNNNLINQGKLQKSLTICYSSYSSLLMVPAKTNVICIRKSASRFLRKPALNFLHS